LRKGRKGREVAHVQGLDPHSERGELVRLRRFTHGGDHLPAVGGILAGELQADAPPGAGDEDPRHQSNRLETEVSSAIRLIASASSGAIGKARIRGAGGRFLAELDRIGDDELGEPRVLDPADGGAGEHAVGAVGDDLLGARLLERPRRCTGCRPNRRCRR
jgi:hypothetical protein